MFGKVKRRIMPRRIPPEQQGGFLNMWAWRPNGFFSPTDEAAIVGAAQRGLGAYSFAWQEHAAMHTRADESFCRNVYQYIPTNAQVIAAQAAEQMRNASERAPYQSQINTPAGMRLVSAIYQQANSLWLELARMSSQSNSGV